MTALTPRPGIMKIAPYVPGKDSVDGKETIAKLSSNEGALGYLEGGAIPARYEAIVEAGLVTEEAKANLPPAELISQISFLTPEQIDAAKTVLAENWGPMVADA